MMCIIKKYIIDDKKILNYYKIDNIINVWEFI